MDGSAWVRCFRRRLNAHVLCTLMAALVGAVAMPASANPLYLIEGNLAPGVQPATADLLDSHRQRIMDDLGVTALPAFSIRLWEHAADYRQALDATTGTAIADAYGFIVRDQHGSTINVLDIGDETPRRVLHQFVHLVSLTANGSLAHNPEWLWESLALYGAGQFYPLQQQSCITLSEAPTLGALSAGNQIHRTGYLLADFILSQFDPDAVRALLASNGDVSRSLQMTTEAFEAAWHRYVLKQYAGSGGIPPILASDQLLNEVIGNTFFLEDGRSLYFDRDHSIRLQMDSRVQTGVWGIRGGTNVCWQILNLEEFCAVFRLHQGQYWLDTVADCGRYALRREQEIRGDQQPAR
jgi:hypothetical protein